MTNEEVIKELKEELKEVITWLAITINKEEMYERKERRKRAIEAALIALEQTRWIPVSEKLPEKNGNYLVTVEANDGTASIKFQMVDHYGPKWLHDEKTRKVIAWMPLPEPYNAESEENEEAVRCKDCYYNDGEVHAECVICDKAESEENADE